MEIAAIKQILLDQERELKRSLEEEKLIEREHKDYVMKFLKHPNIVAILGVRRCGKSVFSFLLANQLKNVGYINFDDERLLGIKTEDLNKIIQAFYELHEDVETIIFDEIQNVRGWELFISRLRGTRRIIITGSNSNLLSGELSTHLTGRYIDFTLYPFSFKEIIGKADILTTEGIAKTRTKLTNYIKGSSFPEFRKFGSAIVIRIYEDIINKDCLRRHHIKREQTFRELAKYMVSNFASEFTYSKLSNVFGIKDVHTTKDYISYLKEAFLIIVVERFSPKLKQQVIAPRKCYNIDHGLGNFISFRLSNNTGRVFENMVCVELFRRKSKDSNLEVYYWKSVSQEEIDFVVKYKNKVRQLIQVCSDISNYLTKEREIKALIKASKELRCNNLLIITDDVEGEEKIKDKKIVYIPLWKWLIQY